ncbi:MAG: 16S rRNA (uracil(1498)-N(3))-methyltransferase [Candidatus Methylacidiphilales bacterium]|nr:RsmE family RNA methyltransferase [Candidatus Methylacidiphilales bacterium]
MKRYFCAQPESALLDADESHHCLNVIRQQPGDLCTIFDGKGLEVKARIVGTEGGRVRFQTVTTARAPRAADTIVLAQALTKTKSMDLIIQKATELGVGEIYPLQSDRSISQVDGDRADTKSEKWRQLTIEAAKQSGQNWLPEVKGPQKVRSFVEDPAHNKSLKLIASLQPEARHIKTVLREQLPTLGDSRRIIVMIGPEGDFTPAEIGEARARGFLPVSLGPIILRSETAAFFVLSAVAYELA